MKIVMTLLVRDEEDILQQNIDYHLSQGVDFFIATDNLSVDSTTRILKDYESRGKLHYILEASDNYNQHEWVTRMARLAYNKYDADWVINNDADEFWWPRDNTTIKAALSSLSKDVNVVLAQRSNMVYIGSDNTLPFYMNMIYRDLYSTNPLGAPLPPKCAHRASQQVVVEQGNHRVSGIGEQKLDGDIIEIFHFPIRTKKQLINKILKGGAAYSRNKELPVEIGRTWRDLYKQYQSSGNLNGYIESQSFDQTDLVDGIQSGRLEKETRLRDYMINLQTTIV